MKFDKEWELWKNKNITSGREIACAIHFFNLGKIYEINNLLNKIHSNPTNERGLK